jgi:hypothetical protein
METSDMNGMNGGGKAPFQIINPLSRIAATRSKYQLYSGGEVR